MTQSTGKDDVTFPITHRKTGETKRLRKVTSDSEHKRIDSDAKEPYKSQKSHAPLFPIKKSIRKMTHIYTICLNITPELPHIKGVGLGPNGSGRNPDEGDKTGTFMGHMRHGRF